MNVLFIYRNPQMGFSIGKVFKPIEEEMQKLAEVESIYMPAVGYDVKALIKNIQYVKRKVSFTHYDIIHITGTEHYLVPFLKSHNVVVTVHDLGSICNGILNKSQKFLKYCIFIFPLKWADALTFISEKSKEEAANYVVVKASHSVCIPDAVDSSYKYEEKDIDKDEPVILHMGTKLNKNLPRVAQALNGYRCKLRIIGRLKDDQIKALEENMINYSNAFGLTDGEIHEEYRKCDVVCFPSTYEGFGMPIIEGQSVGRVVVTSNLSPMKEVADGGAVLVDPNSPDSIRKGFEEALANPMKYIEIGRENVKKYNVPNVTLQYFELYKRMINKQ